MTASTEDIYRLRQDGDWHIFAGFFSLGEIFASLLAYFPCLDSEDFAGQGKPADRFLLHLGSQNVLQLIGNSSLGCLPALQLFPRLWIFFQTNRWEEKKLY